MKDEGKQGKTNSPLTLTQKPAIGKSSVSDFIALAYERCQVLLSFDFSTDSANSQHSHFAAGTEILKYLSVLAGIRIQTSWFRVQHVNHLPTTNLNLTNSTQPSFLILKTHLGLSSLSTLDGTSWLGSVYCLRAGQ